MPWFLLPDNRIVGGGIQSIALDEATDKYPAGEWACWSELFKPYNQCERGRTPVDQVKVLDMDGGVPSLVGLQDRPCAECNGRYCEANDFLCVFCRYGVPRP